MWSMPRNSCHCIYFFLFLVLSCLSFSQGSLIYRATAPSWATTRMIYPKAYLHRVCTACGAFGRTILFVSVYTRRFTSIRIGLEQFRARSVIPSLRFVNFPCYRILNYSMSLFNDIWGFDVFFPFPWNLYVSLFFQSFVISCAFEKFY